ncbi:MAG: hypothetical protein ACOH18_01470 [Candidatus Saccharimonadaceae bacterium]
MTLHRVVWQAKEACTFVVTDEGKPFAVTARPTVTSYWFGTTVGMFMRTGESFGYWSSSNICGFITAWRVAQILPRIETMRNSHHGYDSTLCGLVIAMQGDRHEDRMRERAADLGMEVDELDAELKRLALTWPSVPELCSMWDKLSTEEQDRDVRSVRQAISEGSIPEDVELIARIEVSELRLRTTAEQKKHEDQLIANGLKPEASLRQFMLDIGVANLVYTIFSDFAPSHFDMNQLDREIMGELIGKYGLRTELSLIATNKQPDDPSAHFAEGMPGVTMYWSDFGEKGHPRVILDGQANELVLVRWDYVTERFQLAVRPLGLEKDDSSQDQWMSIEALRMQIGADMKLDGPLPAAQPAPWCIIEEAKHNSFFSRIFG